MVVVAQLVRAPDCGSGGRRFEPDLPPKNYKPFKYLKGFFCSIKKAPSKRKELQFIMCCGIVISFQKDRQVIHQDHFFSFDHHQVPFLLHHR